MLQTNLTHILTADEHKQFIEQNENVMICCGRMGPMCVPVYGIMEELEGEYGHVEFADMEFDNLESHVIRKAPECADFMGLPFTVYYKNGNIVKATSSIQTMGQIREILDEKFSVVVEN